MTKSCESEPFDTKKQPIKHIVLWILVNVSRAQVHRADHRAAGWWLGGASIVEGDCQAIIRKA
jgi:hypothetical protein